MKILFIYLNNKGKVIEDELHDLSIISEIPKVSDEVIGIFYTGLVQRRTFDYRKDIVFVYIEICN